MRVVKMVVKMVVMMVEMTVEMRVGMRVGMTIVLTVEKTACQDEPPRQSRPKREEEDLQKTNRFRPRMEAST